ncbi:MAG TPA: NADH-quinone oxidoreductase subunit NuoE [Dictyoglomaceae bacterium]|nr:NADH-quinone oxidoreductase subunit NuoE [Dictyoglomaceae bacterium]HOL39362.1 NADH-quinone oxidoreductase subunit NuoE [Dictyoglomaceae bacterium]HOP94823.1 NADH-quinone oxidoreductase subunit NuoE [Dictyoglomaceae bacterium]HPP15956.1 NADH-quinone oxidoreductase subunit NuoE [Dictyoglomaceae bacterium]HPU43282.1 NADH-quinone oxidoreductase subunit NuoE [Dictyoglomaceae bacterium]
MATREEILKHFSKDPDYIIEILHALQDNNLYNYLTPEDIKACADYLELPLSYVEGVASFYSMFSLRPRGRFIIRLCDSPPCHLVGSESLLEYLQGKLKVKVGETTFDRVFTLELTSCLGVCAVAPAMMVNEEVYGNLTLEKVDEILEKKRGSL